MNPVRPDPQSEDSRAVARRWLETWRAAGTALEAERWRRVAALTDDQAWNEAVDLLAMWEPSWAGDAGEELLRHQSLFARARRSRAK